MCQGSKKYCHVPLFAFVMKAVQILDHAKEIYTTHERVIQLHNIGLKYLKVFSFFFRISFTFM